MRVVLCYRVLVIELGTVLPYTQLHVGIERGKFYHYLTLYVEILYFVKDNVNSKSNCIVDFTHLIYLISFRSYTDNSRGFFY